jgi:hypothetical protein
MSSTGGGGGGSPRFSEEDRLWDQDLRPDDNAGQNEGVQGLHPEKADGIRTAYDIKGLHNRLDEYTDDELKQIPVLPAGSRLGQNATYIDLRAETCEEFTARGDMEAGPENWYVPKTEVDYQLWNRLIGVRNPERTGDAGDS